MEPCLAPSSEPGSCDFQTLLLWTSIPSSINKEDTLVVHTLFWGLELSGNLVKILNTHLVEEEGGTDIITNTQVHVGFQG